MDKKLEALGLRAVLRQAHVHLPRAITDAIGGPEIVYKPSTPLWPYLVDSRGLADKCTRAWLATRGACRCSRFERGVIPTKGCSECHLLTTDSTVLESRPLDAMFALGAKARLQRGEAIFEDLLDYLSDRLEEYCREAAERANINIKELLDFKTAAVNWQRYISSGCVVFPTSFLQRRAEQRRVFALPCVHPRAGRQCIALTKRKACRASLLWAKRRRGGAAWSSLTSKKAAEFKT